MEEARHTMHANLSVEAFNALQSFCDENGVTVTAFLEVLGATMRDPTKTEQMFSNEFVRAARRLDATRRHRIRR